MRGPMVTLMRSVGVGEALAPVGEGVVDNATTYARAGGGVVGQAALTYKAARGAIAQVRDGYDEADGDFFWRAYSGLNRLSPGLYILQGGDACISGLASGAACQAGRGCAKAAIAAASVYGGVRLARGFRGAARAIPQAPGEITGYAVSRDGARHGLEQAIGRDAGRGVSPRAMLDAVRNGQVVVLNERGEVVTTYARSRPGIRNPSYGDPAHQVNRTVPEGR